MGSENGEEVLIDGVGAAFSGLAILDKFLQAAFPCPCFWIPCIESSFKEGEEEGEKGGEGKSPESRGGEIEQNRAGDGVSGRGARGEGGGDIGEAGESDGWCDFVVAPEVTHCVEGGEGDGRESSDLTGGKEGLDKVALPRFVVIDDAGNEFRADGWEAIGGEVEGVPEVGVALTGDGDLDGEWFGLLRLAGAQAGLEDPITDEAGVDGLIVWQRWNGDDLDLEWGEVCADVAG